MEPRTDIPVIRDRWTSNADIYAMGCAADTMLCAVETLHTRLEAIDRVDDCKRISEEITQIFHEVVATIPDDKKASLVRMLPHVRYSVTITPRVAKEQRISHYLLEDVATVVLAAHEQCKLCAQPEACRRCQLGRCLDRMLPLDRQGSSWADVDIASAAKREGAEW